MSNEPGMNRSVARRSTKIRQSTGDEERARSMRASNGSPVAPDTAHHARRPPSKSDSSGISSAASRHDPPLECGAEGVLGAPAGVV